MRLRLTKKNWENYVTDEIFKKQKFGCYKYLNLEKKWKENDQRNFQFQLIYVPFWVFWNDQNEY